MIMYLALSFFRLASIVQGVVARFHQVNLVEIPKQMLVQLID